MKKSLFFTVLFGGVVLLTNMAAAVERHVPSEYSTIQGAINDCHNGDVVIVAAGTYYESLNMYGGQYNLNCTVRSTDPNDWDVVAATIIDGNGAATTVTLANNLQGNFMGFTITGGTRGACLQSGTDMVLSKCVIANNGGTGVSVNSCNGKVSNCIIKDNGAEGVSTGNGALTLKNSIISGHTTGVAVSFYTNPTITNCTIVDNTNYGVTTAVVYSSAHILNCILWNNGDDLDDNCHATYSCIQDTDDDANGTGNIADDPCFVTGPDGDFYLSQIAAGQAVDSPCVDAGSDTAANLGMDILTTRTDRVSDGGIVDMGYHSVLNPADINGDGNVNLVDFAILASQWLQAPGVPSADIAPLGGDDIVDGLDLGVLTDNWLGL